MKGMRQGQNIKDVMLYGGTAGRRSFHIRVDRRRSGGGGARTRGGMLGGDGKRMQRELMRMKMQMVIVGATIAMLLTSCDEIIKPEQEGTRVGSVLSLPATDGAVQGQERLWTVNCGLPQQDNSLVALLPTGGYSGAWPGGASSGHLEVKTLNRAHAEGSVSTEMWMLSRTIGWWRLKAIRVHPDDLAQVSIKGLEYGSLPNVRQIIDSPFLSRSRIVRSWVPDDEELVSGQILALLPEAFRLRCQR